LTRSLDLPALDRIDTLAQELAMLQDRSKRRIAILGSRHVPVVSVHLVELVSRSLAQEGHSLITSGAQGVNAAVIRSVLEVDAARLTVLLPQSLDRQPRESRDQLDRVLHLVEKPENDELPLPMASSHVQSGDHSPLRPVDLFRVSTTVRPCWPAAAPPKTSARWSA